MISVNSQWTFGFVHALSAYTFDHVAGAACSGDCQTMLKVGRNSERDALVHWIVITSAMTKEDYLICNSCYEEWRSSKLKGPPS